MGRLARTPGQSTGTSERAPRSEGSNRRGPCRRRAVGLFHRSNGQTTGTLTSLADPPAAGGACLLHVFGVKPAHLGRDSREGARSPWPHGTLVLQGTVARKASRLRHLRRPGERGAEGAPPSRRSGGVAVRRASLAGVSDEPHRPRPGRQPDARLALGRMLRPAALHGPGHPLGAAAQPGPRSAPAGLVLLAGAPARGGGALRRRRAAGDGHPRAARPPRTRPRPGADRAHDAPLVQRPALARRPAAAAGTASTVRPARRGRATERLVRPAARRPTAG